MAKIKTTTQFMSNQSRPGSDFRCWHHNRGYGPSANLLVSGSKKKQSGFDVMMVFKWWQNNQRKFQNRCMLTWSETKAHTHEVYAHSFLKFYAQVFKNNLYREM